MKYRKIPVEIEAFFWTGDQSQEEDPEWIIDALRDRSVSIYDGAMYIKTLEGVMRAEPGDYIIKGVEGEIYPCKPSIFKKTYEAV